ncbi:MAG: ribonuclease R [Nitrospinota bacterium]|nr:ribonuclease R [Nitrospinota bacterium]
MDLSESKILKLLRAKTNRPMKFSELMKLFAIPEDQRREFRAQLKEMAAEGSVVKLRGGRYGLPDEMNLIPGVLSGHPDGYGFVVTEDDSEDIYISRHKLNGAMHNDHVLVSIESRVHRFGRPEGRIVRILERRTTTLVGLFEALNRDGWVIPSEHKYFQDVFVPGKEKKGAKPGQLVSVEITTYPTRHNPPVGRVVKILGDANDPEVELRSIIHKFGVRQEFSPKVQNQVQKITGLISDRERKERRDLTDEMIFTIDGERAKDFDDAVSLDTTEDGYVLGVHIADVSHYVTENSPLDKEALERATSIYYADGVIPMLPFELSNEMCSLKPQEERLTLSASITFDKQGNVLDYEIFNSIIKSQFRFTYNQVAEMLKAGSTEKQYEAALPVLQNMLELSQMLRKRRFQEGSVDFNIPEPEILMDEKGHVQNIIKAEHNVAHELIEEFMLAANRVVAEHLDKKNLPGIHRIHEAPDQDKLHRFQEFIKDIGFRLPSLRNVKSEHLQNLLTRVRDHAEERTINLLLLRSLKKAVYSEKDPGHFCLGFEHYTHFTSPIRRYPDLATHRMVKAFLGKKKSSQQERKKLLPLSRSHAEQSTTMEIKAMEVEREVANLRRAQFMADKVGREYSGHIVSVTGFGLFVELDDVFVEGLVHISSLGDDYYVHYEHEHMLKGQHKHKTYRIGDALKVRVTRVDISKKQIDLSPVFQKR